MLSALRLLPTALVILTATAPSAFADAKRPMASPSEMHIQQGIELRRLGDDQAALPKFEKAFELDPTARAAAQLGLCELALGHFASAVPHLTQALHQRGDKWVEGNRAILRDALEQAKAKVARVEVSGEPEGATVTINGKSAGVLPLRDPILVNAGTVDVELTQPGFDPQRRQLTVQGGQFQSVVLRLTPQAARVAEQEPPVKPQPAPVAQQPEETQPSRWLAPAKWTALGVGAVGVAVGIYGWQRHQGLVKEFDGDGCRVDRNGNPGMVAGDRLVTSEPCADKLSRIDAASTLRTVGLVAGGAFLATFLALELFGGDTQEADRPQYSCVPSVMSFACSGVF